MDEQDKVAYAEWILESCDIPIDEIVWLVDNLKDDVRAEMWHPNKESVEN